MAYTLTSSDRELVGAVRLHRRATGEGPTWREVAHAVERPPREAAKDIRKLVHKGWLAADSTSRSLDVGPKFLDLLTRYSNGGTRPAGRKDVP